MDRTAWIAVSLCVIGLVLWELYLAKQTPPRVNPVNASAQASAVPTLTASPSAPPLPEFTASPQSNSAVQFERTTSEQITTRKKFFFPPSTEKKDNFIIGLDVDLENRGPKPYQTAGYFVALGSAAPIHPRDYPS